MKKVIKKSMLVLMVLFAMTSFANEMSSGEDIKKTTLELPYVKEGEQLLIKDLNGLVLYKESIKETGNYNREFDLTSLPNGDYYFELDRDFEIKIIPFVVQATEVVFKKGETNTIFKPSVIIKDNHVWINKLSLDKEILEIKFYYDIDSYGYDEIYSEEVTGVQNIQRAFNLSKNIKGNYKVVCISEGRVFTKYFKI